MSDTQRHAEYSETDRLSQLAARAVAQDGGLSLETRGGALVYYAGDELWHADIKVTKASWADRERLRSAKS